MHLTAGVAALHLESALAQWHLVERFAATLLLAATRAARGRRGRLR